MTRNRSLRPSHDDTLNMATILSTPRTSVGILCGMGAGALWGFVFLAPELARSFSPLTLTIGRYMFYGVVSTLLLAPRWHRIKALLTWREWRGLASLALVGNLFYYLLLSTAVQKGGVATTSLVMGFLPVAVTIIGSRDQGAVSLRQLAPSLALCAGAAICIGWQALVVPTSGTAGQQLPGLLCAVGALASWAWYAVSNSRWLLRLPDVTAHDWSLLTGVATGALTLVLIPVAALTEYVGHASADWLQLFAISAGLALLASIAGGALWNRMSQLLPLTLVGQMILFETLFALLYGFAWERRLPTLLETIAFALVSMSVISCIAVHRRPGMQSDAFDQHRRAIASWKSREK